MSYQRQVDLGSAVFQCFLCCPFKLREAQRGLDCLRLDCRSTGYCVGSASANPDCPWFVPFPAHSYVIICDKHLCSEVTNPRQCPGLLNNSDKATCTDGVLHTETHKCAYFYTLHKQNFGLPRRVGFVFFEAKGG